MSNDEKYLKVPAKQLRDTGDLQDLPEWGGAKELTERLKYNDLESDFHSQKWGETSGLDEAGMKQDAEDRHAALDKASDDLLLVEEAFLHLQLRNSKTRATHRTQKNVELFRFAMSEIEKKCHALKQAKHPIDKKSEEQEMSDVTSERNQTETQQISATPAQTVDAPSTLHVDTTTSGEEITTPLQTSSTKSKAEDSNVAITDAPKNNVKKPAKPRVRSPSPKMPDGFGVKHRESGSDEFHTGCYYIEQKARRQREDENEQRLKQTQSGTPATENAQPKRQKTESEGNVVKEPPKFEMVKIGYRKKLEDADNTHIWMQCRAKTNITAAEKIWKTARKFGALYVKGDPSGYFVVSEDSKMGVKNCDQCDDALRKEFVEFSYESMLNRVADRS